MQGYQEKYYLHLHPDCSNGNPHAVTEGLSCGTQIYGLENTLPAAPAAAASITQIKLDSCDLHASLAISMQRWYLPRKVKSSICLASFFIRPTM